MSNGSEDILRAYMEKLIALRKERSAEGLSDDELKQIALESGMSPDDLAYMEQKLAGYMSRGEGYMRHKNWDGAITELEEAETLAPSNATVLSALAWSYLNRYRLNSASDDRAQAQTIATRCLRVDPSNDMALRVMSDLQTGGRTKARTAQGAAPAQQGCRVVGVGFTVVISLVVLVIGMAVYFIFSKGAQDVPQTQVPPSATEREEPAAVPETPEQPAEDPTKAKKGKASPLAAEVLSFGQEGIGNGMFDDARSVGVDATGRIYVGEYSSGRIQVFDPTGTYQSQWSLGPKKYLRSMTVDRAGTVYAVYNGKVQRFEGATGTLLGELRYGGGPGFVDVSVTPDGGLVAAWDGWYRGGILVNPESKDDIVRFDSKGKVKQVIRRAISSISDQFQMNVRVVVDGLGNTYALSQRDAAVYKFGPTGKYLNKFGGRGREPGQLGSPDAIAVDGYGRVLVADFGGVLVFDGEGRYIDTIPVRVAIGAMVVNDGNELIVQLRHQVIKFSLAKPGK